MNLLERHLVFAAALVAGMSARPSDAQTPDPGTWVANGAVRASAYANGTLYIGGDFTAIGPSVGAASPIDLATGNAQSPSPQIMGQVWAVAPDGQSGYFVGGRFGDVQGQSRTCLAHIDAAGHVTAWNPKPNGLVFALAVSGGIVYVGGAFTQVGDSSRDNVAAIDASTGQILPWNPGVHDGEVHALLVHDRLVYVAGRFSAVGPEVRYCIAAIDSTGSVTPWNANVGLPPGITVDAIAATGGTLYLSGVFTSVGGQSHYNAAAVTLATGAVLPWAPHVDGQVHALAVNGGAVYLGGGFTSVNFQNRYGLAAIDTVSGGLLAWAPSTAPATVDAIAIAGGTVYVGGDFTTMGGQERLHLAAIDAASGAVSAWDPRASQLVRALAITGSRVLAGGDFSSIGCVTRNHAAAIGVDGMPTSWNPNADGAVRALLAYGSAVYLGGDFTHVQGQSRGALAAVDTTGVLSGWNPNANSPVRALRIAVATIPSTSVTIYAGGFFTTVGGLPRRGAAAMDASSGAVTAWNPDVNGDVFALALTVTPRGAKSVFLGGQLNAVGGVPRNGLAAVDASGAVLAWDPDITTQPNLSGIVYALAISQQSSIYVGGSFSAVGGVPRRGLAEVDLSAGTARAFDPNPVGPANDIQALWVGDQALFAGGNFDSIGGAARSAVGAVDPTTGQATSWNPRLENSGYLGGIASATTLAQAGSTVYVGGDFAGCQKLPYTCLTAFRDVAAAVGDAPPSRGVHGIEAAPNPFRASTNLAIATTAGQRGSFDIFDVRGRRVRALPLAATGAEARVTWDGKDGAGRDVAPGAYFARLRNDASGLAVELLRVR